MIYELLYTSAPAGLRPGSSGYCTVQSSRGIPAPTVDLLESLSGYRHVYTAGTPDAKRNPVNFGHYVLRVQGRSQHVLSRVSDCPLDHTGRSNKIGHHMVVDDPDGIPAGPAWLMQQPGWMIDHWDGQVTTLNTVRKAPSSKRPAGVCTAWKQATGDAGWAGVLAEAFQKNPDRKVFVIYKPGTNLLALFEEALALLPASRRWDVTFSTYGAALPATIDCAWNGVISGSQEEHLSKRFVNALRLDLTKPAGPAPDAGPLVELARTGKLPSQPTAPQQPQHPTHAAAPASVSASDVVSDSFTRVADPAAPPPVRRPVQKKTNNMRLILTLLVCCLLFGGGTAAGVVYFLQKDKPVVVADVKRKQEDTNQDKAAAAATQAEVQPTDQPAPPVHANQEMTEAPASAANDEKPDETKSDNEPMETKAKPSAPTVEKSNDVPPQKPEKPKLVVSEFYAQRPVALRRDENSVVSLPEKWADGITDDAEVTVYFPVLKENGSSSDFRVKSDSFNKAKKSRVIEWDFPINSALSQEALRIEMIWESSVPTLRLRALTDFNEEQRATIRGAAISFVDEKHIVTVYFNRPLVVSNLSLASGRFSAPLADDIVLSQLITELQSSAVECSNTIQVQSEGVKVDFESRGNGQFVSQKSDAFSWPIESELSVFETSGKPHVGAFVPDLTALNAKVIALGTKIVELKSELETEYKARTEEELKKIVGQEVVSAKWNKVLPSYVPISSSDFEECVQILESIENVIEKRRDKQGENNKGEDNGKRENKYAVLLEFLGARRSLFRLADEHAKMESFKKKMTLTKFDVYYKLYPIYGNDKRELRSLLITTRQDVNAER